MTKIYHYDPKTGEYRGEATARLDPIEQKPMIPAYATALAPPSAQAGKCNVFENGAWIQKTDQRGKQYWDAKGDHQTITDIGVSKPADARDTAPAITITALHVRAEAARRLDAFVSIYTPQERETWHGQIHEARAYEADNTASTPFLSARAAKRGVSVATLAQDVLTKAAAFAAYSGDVLGAQDTLIAISPVPQDFEDDKHWPSAPAS